MGRVSTVRLGCSRQCTRCASASAAFVPDAAALAAAAAVAYAAAVASVAAAASSASAPAAASAAAANAAAVTPGCPVPLLEKAYRESRRQIRSELA